MNSNENNKKDTEAQNSSAMTNKRDVDKSPDEKTDQDFPGYPHYPAKEDIMDQRTGSHRVDANLENSGTGPNFSGVNQRFVDESGENSANATSPQRGNSRGDGQDDLELGRRSESDVTSDDLAALNSTDAEIGRPQNISNEDLSTDLDVPGSELDDEDEALGEEDEENNYYSLGGDRHEAQEEDPQSGPDRG